MLLIQNLQSLRKAAVELEDAGQLLQFAEMSIFENFDNLVTNSVC